ncbi:MAG TPA: hypothetical protein VNH22_02245 [Blastocatellia bacterium]|nr:hypothetical protein [Blastocatellia bacterium]
MMSSSGSKTFLNSAGRAPIFFILSLLALLSGASCRASDKGAPPSGLVVVNAPASGEVRRVLVNEGSPVNEGAVLVEIAVEAGAPAAQQDRGDEGASARAALEAARREMSEAEAEVNRAAVEAQRIEPLVQSGAAPQSQLDAARAQYQQAQERLDRLRNTAQSAQNQIVSSEGRRLAAGSATAEKIVEVRVPVSGTVRVLRARVGQQITEGQPLATLSSARQ